MVFGWLLDHIKMKSQIKNICGEKNVENYIRWVARNAGNVAEI